MRLTLRTLLAYLDRILDEDDSGELEKKIQESEVANELVHRIQKVLAQRRSDSLSVDIEGMGQDANSVAEYLDNTLPSEHVPHFERVTLESDTHLAEVAACHQILTLVLGEPAEVPNELKQRMYRLRDQQQEGGVTGSSSVAAVEAPVQRKPSDSQITDDEAAQFVSMGSTTHRVDANAKPAAVVTPVDEDERWTEAPDYLKRPKPGRWKPLVLATLIAFCLAMAAIFSQPLDQTHPLASFLGLSDVAPAESDDTISDPGPLPPGSASAVSPSDGLVGPGALGSDGQTPDIESTDNNAPPTDSNQEPVGDAPENDLAADLDGPESPEIPDTTAVTPNDLEPAPGIDDLANAERDEIDLGPLDVEATNEPANLLTDSETASPIEAGDSELPPDDGSTDPRAASPNIPNATGDDLEPFPNPTIADTDNEELQPPSPPTIVNPLATNTNADPNDPVGLVPVLPRTGSDTDADVEPTTVAPEKPPVTDVGRFLDDQQVLIRLNPGDNSWQRVPSGEPLQVGQTLVSLPTFRTPLAFGSGMQVTMVGATKMQLLPTEDEQAPIFGIEYGRLVVATFTQTGAKFGVQWGSGRTAEFTVTDMNTNLAMEVKRMLIPGSNPESDEGHDTLVVHVTSGSVEWQAGEDPAIQVSVDRRLAVIDDRAPQLEEAASTPGWIDGSDAAPRDPVAAAGLAKRLTTDRPATLVLLEEADDNSRYRDVRSLAVCSLAQFGQYSPLLVALNDPEQRAYWSSQYDVLMELINRSPETAAAVKRAVVDYHDDELGEQLFRTLSGYSPGQLENGGAQTLVDYLDHADTDFRLIASEMLRRITGMNSLYRAHASERNPQRRAATNRWRKLLEEGKITYAEKPLVVQLLASTTPNEADTDSTGDE